MSWTARIRWLLLGIAVLGAAILTAWALAWFLALRD